LSWHRVHNEAFRRLGGIPAVLRIDYVPGHIINLLCPTSLCSQTVRSRCLDAVVAISAGT